MRQMLARLSCMAIKGDTKMRWRIIDNNYQWSNWHKSKKEAILELKRQRGYDNAFYTYGLQCFIDSEWLTVKWFNKEGGY